MCIRDSLDRILHHGAHALGHVVALQHLVALAVDDLALLVHDVVKGEDVFADAEVLALDLFLSALDGAGDLSLIHI